MSRIRRMMFGIAGSVGEWLWREGSGAVLWIEELEALVSDTDWDTIGLVPGCFNPKLARAGHNVLGLLRGRLYAEWCDVARQLMQTGEVWSADGPRMRRMREAATAHRLGPAATAARIDHYPPV
jgi:hypothetical protein